MLVALELVCDLGTNVVYVEPQWPNSHNCIHLTGAEPRPAPLRLDAGGWHLDLDALFARDPAASLLATELLKQINALLGPHE